MLFVLLLGAAWNLRLDRFARNLTSQGGLVAGL